jgi:hypothetical protein
MTDAGRGTLGADALLSQDEVALALATPLPSELLLKGECPLLCCPTQLSVSLTESSYASI